MEFPAICQSQTLRLPANFTGKPKAHFQILLGKISGQSKRNHIVKSGQASTENCSSSSISTTFKDERDRALEKLSKGKSWIHFVGIGGCGLSALAMLAIKQGFEVSGSDVGWSSYMDALQEAGACLHIGHSVTDMQRNSASRFPDAIVVSSAIPQDNVEILYSKSAGVPVYKRDHWLGQLTQCYNLIAVSGSHGENDC